jgi:hypothetical protein
MNKSRTIKTGNKWYRHRIVECLSIELLLSKLARVKYLCDYGIDKSNLFCPCVSSWGISSCAVEFHFLQAGTLVAFWRMIELHSTLCGLCLTSRAIPVKFHNCNDSVTRVVGNDRFLLSAQATSCRKPRDYLGWVHSDQMVLKMIRQGRLVW